MFRWYWVVCPQALAGTIFFSGEAVTRGEDEVAAARCAAGGSLAARSELPGTGSKHERRWSMRGGRLESRWSSYAQR